MKSVTLFAVMFIARPVCAQDTAKPQETSKPPELAFGGKLLGEFGKLGRLPGWFDSVHALACPDEKTLYLAEEFSFRFDKVVLQ